MKKMVNGLRSRFRSIPSQQRNEVDLKGLEHEISFRQAAWADADVRWCLPAPGYAIWDCNYAST